jgi:hypothetical protein
MNDRSTALERAFQLARSGRPKSIDDIKRELVKEHYSSGQIKELCGKLGDDGMR